MSQAKQIVKHSSIYAVGNISRQLVGFLMLPVYTRFLSPADYGVVGLLIFMISLIELLFGGHLFHAVPKFYFQKESETERRVFLSTALITTVFISSVTVSLVVIFRENASQILFGTAEYSHLVSLFAVLILTHALENYAMVFIRIQKKPWLFVGASTTKLVLQLSLNIYFVVILQMGVFGVAISTMTSSILFTGVMTAYTVWHTKLAYQKEIAITLIRFSWPLWVGGIAGLYIGSANRYFIRIFGSLDDVGLFELAAKFGSVILVLVWTPFAQYWQTERFSIYKQSNPIPIYQGVFKTISTLLVLAALGISLFSAPVIEIMSDKKFHAASLAIPFLTFGAVFQCLTIFNNFSFLLKEKTSWMSRNSYFTAAIITIFYLILIPKFGYVGAAISLLAAFIIQFIIVFYSAKVHYDMQLSLAPLFYSIFISSIIVGVNTLFTQESSIKQFFLSGSLFIAGSTAILLPIFRDPAAIRLLNDFKPKKNPK